MADARQPTPHDDCYRCWDERTQGDGIMERMTSRRMFLCPTCGNKRCPKASDHRLACSGSNRTGQKGSIYA
jgi:DNA-directed RNA polymerase subunit RPC12/RpoP